jgi:hypothetical protein
MSQGGADAGARSAMAGEGGVNSAEAGAGGASAGTPPAAQAGSGGEGGYGPTGPRIACPAVGQKFELSPTADSDEDRALRGAFDCPLGRTFSIERFQLNQTRLEVLSSLYYFDNYDWFTVIPDCGPVGFVEPVTSYTAFPSLFAEVLAPGIYTRVSCQNDMLEEQVAVPTPAPNVDCDHAVTLTPGGVQTGYAETRIWNQTALFYKLSLSEPAQPDTTWELTINGSAAETSGSPTVKLHGLSSTFEQEGEIHALNTGHPAIFNSVPPGDYCVEVSTENGVKYSIFYGAFASP